MLLYISMVTAFEIPDFAADKATHKHTFTVRWGYTATGALQIAAMVIAYLSIAFLAQTTARFVWLLLPLAVWQIINVAWRMKYRCVSSITP